MWPLESGGDGFQQTEMSKEQADPLGFEQLGCVGAAGSKPRGLPCGISGPHPRAVPSPLCGLIF